MLKNEWRKLFKSKFMVVVLIAVMLIPTIYTAIFVGAMWDPYGRLENLPVAVVNEDKAVTYNEKELHVGADLVKNLKENNSLGFNFVDAEEAAKGLAKGKYYMIITIPEDFSKNATTLMEDKTKKMELHYETNPGQNYIASKMSETAVKEIQANIREKITTQYTETVFEQLGTIGDGFVEAADGALQITDGTDKLLDGNKEMSSGLDTLSKGTLALKTGSTDLRKGLDTYTKGVGTLEQGSAVLNNKSSDLNAGVGSVSEGVVSLKSGSSAILAGMNTMSGELAKSLSKENAETMSQLQGGLTAINQGIQDLNTAVQDMDVADQVSGTVGAVETGLTSIGGNLQAAQGHMGELSAAIQALQTQLMGLVQSGAISAVEAQALLAPLAESAGNVGGDVTEIATVTQGMADTLQSKKTEMSSIVANVDTLKTSVDTLAKNSNIVLPGSSQAITQLTTGLKGIQSALDRTGNTAQEMGLIQAMGAVDNGLATLDAGVNGLKSGVSAYTSGVSSVAEGAKTLSSNSNALVSGAGKITDGADALSEGAVKLEDGSGAIGDGLTELKKGSNTLAESLGDAADEVNGTKTDEDTVDMFAAPVTSVGSEYSYIENNGSAMAAYMMGVGLWVACIAFCTIYPLSKPSEEVKTGFSWWFSKASVYLSVSAVQAVVMIFMLKLILGFQPKYLGRTILVAVAASLAFMSVMYFFNVCFGKVGSYLMLIFMVLQLGGSAGTYPLELSSDFYHEIHERMPFTYSVNAFRATISTGNDIMPQMIIFIGMIVVFNLLSLAVFVYKAKKGETEFIAETIGE